MKKLYCLILLFTFFQNAGAQFVFKPNQLPDKVSIINYSFIADAGDKNYSVGEVLNKPADLKFRPQSGKTGNLGFTDHTYWLKFELINQTTSPIFYYLETAEPVTDQVRLFLIGNESSVIKQLSGDNLPFREKSVPFRKTFFKVELAPGEQKLALMEVRNDGEKNNLPLNLISAQQFLRITYHDQMIMGLFYGILLVIAITYLFFYFAISEKIFLFYVLYVVFAGLCHFALDGFFHQYLNPANSWVNLHAVIIFAIAACYFFGRYSELVLHVKENSRGIAMAFRVLYSLLAVTLAGILLFPAFLKFSYPLVNVLTLVGMVLIVVAIGRVIYKRQRLDLFYTLGISFLFISFTLVILLNFGLLSGFTVENITKPGIGLEIVFLSLSMANRIRLLKSKKEELQAIALQKAEEMNEVKSYFLSNMSHELRTPLNVILGLTNALESESDTTSAKIQCGQIKDAAFSLISSVNDIMDFSMIEKGQIRLETAPFAPQAVLEKAAANFHRQASAKGLQFNFFGNVDSQTTVLGDAKRLEQIVNNVLSNAVKFTNQGIINLSAEAVPNANGRLEIKMLIEDTGIGISEAKLSSVFEMFSQVDISNKRQFGGFGIGLCVVHALVKLQGGEINLSSVEREGTVCKISLDYAPAPVEIKVKSAFPEDTFDLLGKHVLIVEDNPMNQMVLKMMMKKWLNTNVSFSNNGLECLEMLKKSPVDIVLMDLQMPVMDGYEATAAIRHGDTGEENKLMPILVITADVMESTRERIFELGADDYLTKPVDQKMLYKKITGLLS